MTRDARAGFLRRGCALVLSVLPLAACGDAKAPVQLGFTGTCELAVPRDAPRLVQTLYTPDQLKTHVRLRITQGTLVDLHVEAPDYREATTADSQPDHPLLVGDARPNVPLDPDTDVDVPVNLAARGTGAADSGWHLAVRVRFHGQSAEAIVGRMRTAGDCVPAPPG